MACGYSASSKTARPSELFFSATSQSAHGRRKARVCFLASHPSGGSNVITWQRTKQAVVVLISLPLPSRNPSVRCHPLTSVCLHDQRDLPLESCKQKRPPPEK